MKMPPLPTFSALAFAAACTAQLPSPDHSKLPVIQIDQPQELGAIAWTRDFEAGRAAVEKNGKPMLLLFQEVPG